MSNLRILVTHPEVPQEAVNLLSRDCDVIVCQNVPPVRADILEKSKGVDAILWAWHDKLDAEALDAAGPQLKSISLMSAGYDYVDVAELKRRKIPTGYTPAVLNKAVADVAIGLMISACRRFHEGRVKIETSAWEKASLRFLLGQEIRGAKVGFFGFGGIGQAIADRLAGFEIDTIIYHKRTPLSDEDAQTYKAKLVPFDQLLQESDILFIASPSTEETCGKFNESAFNKMKSSAVLINIARGEIIDQKALLKALKANTIFAAGLDVMTPEPLPADDPLLGLPNLVLLPHIGSATERTRGDMAILAANNVLQGLAGAPMFAPLYKP